MSDEVKERDASDVAQPKALWLDLFAGCQTLCGLIFAGAGLLRSLRLGEALLDVSFPPVGPSLSMGLAHLLLAWAIWRRRRWAWIPHLFVVGIPLVLLSLSSHFASSIGGAPSMGLLPPLPVILLVLSAVAVIGTLYVWEWLVLLILLSPDGRRLLVAGQHPIQFGLMRFLILGAAVASAVGSDLHEYLEYRNEIEGEAEISRQVQSFIDAAEDNDAQAIKAARSQTTERALELLEQRIDDLDMSVRREIARLQGVDSAEHPAVLAEIVYDQQQTAETRRQALKKMLTVKGASTRYYRFDYAAFFATLVEIERKEALGVVPIVAESIADRTRNHWKAWSMPDKEVNFLGTLGSDAGDAVPALVVCLDHPNRSMLLPIVCQALGEIGPAAEAAVPKLLVLLEQTDYGLHRAVKEALIEIDGAWGLTISGRVSDDLGRPLAGAQVEMSPLDSNSNKRLPLATVETDSQGRFAMPQIPRGSAARLLGRYAPEQLLGVTDVLWNGPDKLAWSREVDITAFPTGTVTGTVLVDGRPKSGVRVTVNSTWPNEDSVVHITGHTDANGRYRIEFVPPADAEVIASCGRGFTRVNHKESFEAERTHDLKPFKLYARNMTVSGIVVNQQDRPAAGVLVVAEAPDLEYDQLRRQVESKWFMPVDLTGDDGRFVIERLPNVSLSVTAYPHPRTNQLCASQIAYWPDRRDPDQASLTAEAGMEDLRIVISVSD